MAAPSAPRIRAHSTGGLIVRLAWAPVDDATSYNIYLGDTLDPIGLEDTVLDDDAEDNGSFIWFSDQYVGPLFVRVTAVNAGAEESGYSDQYSFNLANTNDGMNVPTPALNHAARQSPC